MEGHSWINVFTITLQQTLWNLYLGIVSRYNEKFYLAINTLMEKARKAFFKIRKILGLYTCTCNPCIFFENKL